MTEAGEYTAGEVAYDCWGRGQRREATLLTQGCGKRCADHTATNDRNVQHIFGRRCR